MFTGGCIALPRNVAEWLQSKKLVRSFTKVPPADLEFSFTYKAGDDVVAIDPASSYRLENGFASTFFLVGDRFFLFFFFLHPSIIFSRAILSSHPSSLS